MNVHQIMEDVILKQHVQIQLVVSHVNVKLDILEMVSVVMVFIYFLSLFILSFIHFFEKKKIDINECSTNNGGCSTNALCTNNPGSFSCSCKNGFDGNGTTCNGNDFFVSFFFQKTERDLRK